MVFWKVVVRMIKHPACGIPLACAQTWEDTVPRNLKHYANIKGWRKLAAPLRQEVKQ